MDALNPFNDDDNEPENEQRQDNQREQDNQQEPEIRACPANLGEPTRNDEEDDDDDDERRILYRGDSRDPSEVFGSGFQPRGTNTDLERYIRDNEPSIYVGTSKKYSVGVGFATDKGRQPGFVYVVSDPGGGIDVNQEFRRITGEGNPYFREQEIAFPGGISTQDIRGAIPVGADLNPTGPEIPNPNYRRRR